MKTSQPKPFVQTRQTCRDGFTLLDLVVVLGVIAVLILVELPVLAGTKSQTKIGVCASHVRQLALACQLYANENNNRLPVPGPQDSASWAWDLPFSSAKGLLKYGVTKNTFYCPGTAPRFTDLQNWQDVSAEGRNLWDFGDNAWPPQNATGGFHIVGYCLAFSGSASILNSTNQNTTMLPETLQIRSTLMPAPAASERVLLADATISGNASDHQGATVNTYNFTQINGGFYKPHLSPHLKGKIPAGGNLGFKDGHVAWRKFQDMDERAASSVGFWW